MKAVEAEILAVQKKIDACSDLEERKLLMKEKELLREERLILLRRREADINMQGLLNLAVASDTSGVFIGQSKDEVITGIYLRLEENESEPSSNTFIKFGPLHLLVRQEWIDLKNVILSGEVRHQTIFLRGSSGRGKSCFIYYLMYCILLEEKNSKKRKDDQYVQPLIIFIKNKVEKFLLTLNEYSVASNISSSVYFHISDTKDDVPETNLAQRFTMAVASDDFGKKEFGKRVNEAGCNGKVFVMTSPTREQMHLIFEDTMSHDEIDFRLDVVGCNPRGLPLDIYGYTPDSDSFFSSALEETCVEVLGISKSDDNERFEWVTSVVMRAIEVARYEDRKITLNNLFREKCVHGRQWPTFYTITFMSFLAGNIRDKFRSDTMGVLTTLFGPSGIGNCHEYDCHKFFSSSSSLSHPCWKSRTNEWVNLSLGGLREKVFFRDISDISRVLRESQTVHSSKYLVPTITNLPIIDSIIAPNIVLQMTISPSHRGASNRMGEIYDQLGRPSVVIMLFVVPEDVLAIFSFPIDLPDYVEMYVTIPKFMELKDAKKLRKSK